MQVVKKLQHSDGNAALIRELIKPKHGDLILCKR